MLFMILIVYLVKHKFYNNIYLTCYGLKFMIFNFLILLFIIQIETFAMKNYNLNFCKYYFYIIFIFSFSFVMHLL